MPTTDATLAKELLATLDEASVGFAVLHGEERLGVPAPTSDVDVIVDRPGGEVLRLLSSRHRGGLIPVLAWESETATLNTFWCLPDGSGGVQLDLLYDPAGRSMLAVRTADVLSRRVRGQHTWRISEPDRQAYMASKRWLKGDRQAVRALRTSLPVSASAAYAGLAPKGRRRIDKILGGQEPSPSTFRWRVLRSRLSPRGIRRVSRPCGYQVHLASHHRFAADVLAGVLVGVRHVQGGSAFQRAKAAVLVRRPFLVVRDAASADGAPVFGDTAAIVAYMNNCLRKRGWIS